MNTATNPTSETLIRRLSRGPTNHELKLRREYFVEVKAGRKTAELRVDDRDFRIGDTLVLREWGPHVGYTGKHLVREITHITRCGHWIEAEAAKEWVILHMGISG